MYGQTDSREGLRFFKNQNYTVIGYKNMLGYNRKNLRNIYIDKRCEILMVIIYARL